DGTACLFLMVNQSVELVSACSTYSNTKDNASTINVYWDSVNSDFAIQNKIANNKNVKWIVGSTAFIQ
ncbi:MAG TPA: hypothetical protein P5056_04255, partial [Candidatus Paceibacterota bacterium]|nr:hypothetical protein [Candidatus Paceibacterota bacterium]